MQADPDLKTAILNKLDRPVVMIGLMGAGKSRMGFELARALGLDFVDSDDEITQAAGCSIPEIFERFGEAAFRDGERRVIRRLLDNGVCVIATGGGAVMTSETADAIWSGAISVWVRADIPVSVERTARTDRRPLLRNGDPEKILSKLAEIRYPVYEKADIEIDTTEGRVDDILKRLLERLYDYLYQGKDSK